MLHGLILGLELRMTTSTRLKTCLYSFTSPGGPMYPTRAVRHAAWDALDFLFPVSNLSQVHYDLPYNQIFEVATLGIINPVSSRYFLYIPRKKKCIS